MLEVSFVFGREILQLRAGEALSKVSSHTKQLPKLGLSESSSLLQSKLVSKIPQGSAFDLNKMKAAEGEKLSSAKDDAKAFEKVGEIIIRVFRQSAEKLENTESKKITLGSGEKEVHEKALKGQTKSHGTSYVVPIPTLLFELK